MKNSMQEIGRIGRFFIERPLASMVLMLVFIGLLVIESELFLWPRINDDPVMYWGFRYSVLLAIPISFLFIYNFSRESLTRWNTDIQTNLDRKTAKILFHDHPFLAPTLMALLVGAWALLGDLLTIFITGSSLRIGTLFFTLTAFIFSFVVCYTSIRALVRLRTEESLNNVDKAR